ncbi:hypothetical protein AB0A05_39190, partial [Streptomyces sp. NPDC046374]
VGSHLINPADLTEESDGLVRFRKPVLGAAYTANAPAENAYKETFEKVRDMVTGLVKAYQADTDTPAREATYAKFLDTKRAEATETAIGQLDAKAKALMIQRAALVEKLNAYKAA